MTTSSPKAGDEPVVEGWPGPITRVRETGSTNADLLAAAAAGAPDRSVLVAEHQTAGRGRLDRTWDAPPGANLLVSVLFRSGFDVKYPHRLTQAVALAAADTAAQLTGLAPELKWPNDLLIDGAKVAGILAQSASLAGEVVVVVVGMGFNLGWAPPGAARLAKASPDEFLSAWLPAVNGMLLTDCFAAYRARLATIGQAVRVDMLHETVIGEAIDVQPDGALVVATDHGRRIISVGDVVHLRRPSAQDPN